MTYPSRKLAILESNLDDMNPEWFEPLMDQLFKRGALDVWFIPIIMKKSRPAILLQVLCQPKKKKDLVGVILNESTTLGVRSYEVERFELQREVRKIKTPYGRILVKVGLDAQGRVMNVAPEYESCRQLSLKKKIPLKKIYAACLKKS